MRILKNDIPILEFDPEERAVIMPDHEHIDARLPRKAVFAFLGDEIDIYARAPTGAAPAAQFLDWLIGYGAREIVSAGSCGALEDIAENTFLVPCRALRDEATTMPRRPGSSISTKGRGTG